MSQSTRELEKRDADVSPNFTVTGPILDKWNSLGGAAGLLGAAQSNVTTCPDGVGQFVRFASGMIYWTPSTGAFSVHGNILAKWASLGYEKCTFLGYPITDESGCPDGVGRYNRFQNGMIYWTPSTGAFSIHGDILGKWASLGYETCAFLGYPITDETGCPDGVGRFNRFQNGMIYWTPTTGAFSIHGDILGKWSALGYEKSQLGYPTSDEGDLAGTPGGRVNSFQNGQMLWTAAQGPWVQLSQLDLIFSPIVFDNGVPVGGYAQLLIKHDGSYAFSGHLHDSGATAYTTAVVYAVKDAKNQVYTFSHTGNVAGTFESGSRDDNWSVTGVNAAIGADWANFSGGAAWVAKAQADFNWGALGSAVMSAIGAVATVVSVVGKALGGGGGNGGGA